MEASGAPVVVVGRWSLVVGRSSSVVEC